jgi:hypothetical protein
MKLARRFVPVVDAAWHVCLTGRLPRDLRRKISELVASNLFVWETEVLRDERIMQQWDFIAFCDYLRDVPQELQRGQVVEPWSSDFVVLGQMEIRAIFISRRYRGKWPKQRFQWVWVEKRLRRAVVAPNHVLQL